MHVSFLEEKNYKKKITLLTLSLSFVEHESSGMMTLLPPHSPHHIYEHQTPLI
jgi:hypothetical protein